jgi:signal transduction histidine kinase
MFEPFVTTGRIADPSDTAARPAGLGLAVVAAIVDAHHGRVDVDSGPSGTRVELRLPR